MAGMLRHWAVDEGVDIDSDGWAEIDDVLDAIDTVVAEPSDIRRIVQNDEKGRYEIRGSTVRALYGHSIDCVSIERESSGSVPNTLYHGTQVHNLESILLDGLMPMNRNTVQMSSTVDEAIDVGDRHGSHTVVIVIDAGSMANDGHSIQKRNSVYVADRVPPSYITSVKNVGR